MFNQKYWRLFQISWESSFIYRLNFIMWRVRTVLRFLTIYFLWYAILQEQAGGAFGYSRAELLTYIIGTSIMSALVFSTRSTDLQGDIGSGDLNNLLVRPFNFFYYWLTKDVADKLLNIIFSIGELILLYFLLKPPLILPPSLSQAAIFIFAAFLGMLIYFFFSMLISMSVFWLPENNGWPQRFFISTMLQFFSGGLFPLDILPTPLYAVVSRLPTAYFLNTPLQIYLGRIQGAELIITLIIMVAWVFTLFLFAKWVLKQGLKVYGAYGR